MSRQAVARASRRALAALLLAVILATTAVPASAAVSFYNVSGPLDCAVYLNSLMSGGFAEAYIQTPAGIDAGSFYLETANCLRMLYSDYIVLEYSQQSNRRQWHIKITMHGVESGRAQAEAKARAVVEQIVEDGMTQAEKLAVIHDYVIDNCEYDTAAAEDRQGATRNAFTAYGMLVRGKGVCDAYSSAFALLCRYAGVPCMYFISLEMDHSWNVVLLGNQLLFVDTTFDDTGDTTNTREYFLLTPEQLRAKDHVWDDRLLNRVTEIVWPEEFRAAGSLSALGLFRGTDAGFELERTPTRAEGSLMLLRLMGMESAAAREGSAMQCPFDDVTGFYRPYIAFMRERGLTQGTSDTTFSPGQDIGLQQYLTFVLRALGYDDSAGDFEWKKALGAAVDFGVLSEEEAVFVAAGRFDRGAMAYISLRALYANSKSGVRLADYLMGQRIISRSIFAEVEKYS